VASVEMTETTDIAGLSFEAALAELERIVAELESGQAELEQSIKVYERGAALKAHCEAKLKEAQLRVEKILLGPGGAEGVEPASFS
jgi:exodeoxyribonuclease VII small subunit